MSVHPTQVSDTATRESVRGILERAGKSIFPNFSMQEKQQSTVSEMAEDIYQKFSDGFHDMYGERGNGRGVDARGPVSDGADGDYRALYLYLQFVTSAAINV